MSAAFDQAFELFGARLPEAAAAVCRAALAADAGQAELWHLLGVIAHNGGDPAAAVAHLDRAVELRPDDAEARGNLAHSLYAAGRTPAAVAAFRAYLARRPDDAAAHARLGDALRALDRMAEAAAAYREAIARRPADADAHGNYAGALLALGQDAEAAAACREALRLHPDNLAAGLNLAVALARCGDLDGAVGAGEAAAAAHPDDPRVHRTLALLYKDQAMTGRAVACYRRAIALEPDNAASHSGMLFLLLYDPGLDYREVLAEHRRWGQRHAATRTPVAHANTPEPERRLRVGYLSADFCYHSKAEAFAPLIEAYDRDRFEVICYSGTAQADDRGAQFRRAAGGWCDTRGLDDAALAARIRGDRIDILVDLSGHTLGNRLRAMAHKPAPVQAGWLDVTGVAAVDALITDRVLWPPADAALITETLVHLPDGALGYRPPAAAPPVAPPPALDRGHLTFGSFNSALKLGPPVLDLWAEILGRVADARLVLKNPSFDDPALRDRFAAAFAERGVAPARVAFLGRSSQMAQLAAYAGIDVALDTFPGNGGVTTWEALWMGVPVVTLRGHPPAGNNGAAILTFTGLTELIAETPAAYADLAAGLAADPAGLAERRRRQRRQLAAAPILEPRAYARSVEAAYRRLWHRWCARRTPAGGDRPTAAAPATDARPNEPAYQASHNPRP